MRAGRPNSGDWQIGVGVPLQGASQGYVSYYTAPGVPRDWRSDGSQRFEIGWDAQANRAYTSVEDSNGGWTTVQYQNTGSTVLPTATWTLPAGGFWASATPNLLRPSPSSILLAGLSLSPNVTLVSGSLPATFGAAQNGLPQVSVLQAPLVLDASANGGSWYVAGTVQFSGLTSQPGGTASNSRLQFFLNATSSQTPEPGSMAMLAGGLLLIGVSRLARKNSR